jgi:hypothetical protein
MDPMNGQGARCGVSGCGERSQRGNDCPRCGRALCVHHTPDHGGLCAECESTFTIANTRSPWWYVAFWVPFCVPWVVYAAYVPQLAGMPRTPGGMRRLSLHPLYDFFFVSLFVGVLLGSIGRGVRKVILRRRFRRCSP